MDSKKPKSYPTKNIFSCFGLLKDNEVLDIIEEGIHKAKETSKQHAINLHKQIKNDQFLI